MAVLRRARRLVLLVLLLVTNPVVHALETCRGWSGSAAERMACCNHEASNCGAVSADSCCAEGEQRRNVETPAALVTVADSAASEPSPVVTPPETILPAEPHLHDQQTSTYLLDSVFRI